MRNASPFFKKTLVSILAIGGGLASLGSISVHAEPNGKKSSVGDDVYTYCTKKDHDAEREWELNEHFRLYQAQKRMAEIDGAILFNFGTSADEDQKQWVIDTMRELMDFVKSNAPRFSRKGSSFADLNKDLNFTEKAIGSHHWDWANCGDDAQAYGFTRWALQEDAEPFCLKDDPEGNQSKFKPFQTRFVEASYGLSNEISFVISDSKATFAHAEYKIRSSALLNAKSIIPTQEYKPSEKAKAQYAEETSVEKFVVEKRSPECKLVLTIDERAKKRPGAQANSVTNRKGKPNPDVASSTEERNLTNTSVGSSLTGSAHVGP